MAFKTLDQLRTSAGGLNDELGLTSDSDDQPFGNAASRTAYIQKAIAKLWPRMARLERENVTTLTNVQDYTLTTLYDVQRIEVIDPTTATVLASRIRSWQHLIDEAADPPTLRLLIPRGTLGGLTLRVIGYAPYTIPASGGASCDIPPRLEWVVVTGARVEAYRATLGKFMAFERFQNENRQTALTAADVQALFIQAQREFSQALSDNGRRLSGAHRAQLQTGNP